MLTSEVAPSGNAQVSVLGIMLDSFVSYLEGNIK